MADPFSQEFWAENNDLDRPPICQSCGVTMLPADAFGSGFSCQNDDCDANEQS